MASPGEEKKKNRRHVGGGAVGELVPPQRQATRTFPTGWLHPMPHTPERRPTPLPTIPPTPHPLSLHCVVLLAPLTTRPPNRSPERGSPPPAQRHDAASAHGEQQTTPTHVATTVCVCVCVPPTPPAIRASPSVGNAAPPQNTPRLTSSYHNSAPAPHHLATLTSPVSLVRLICPGLLGHSCSVYPS